MQNGNLLAVSSLLATQTQSDWPKLLFGVHFQFPIAIYGLRVEQSKCKKVIHEKMQSKWELMFFNLNILSSTDGAFLDKKAAHDKGTDAPPYLPTV